MLSNLILGVGHEKVIICRRNVSEALGLYLISHNLLT